MREVPLASGGTVSLRPLSPEDGPALAAAVRELSPRSRYLRFHTPQPLLDAREIEHLTRVDQRDRAAWVALEGGKGVALGRYARLPDRPDAAEVAVAVLDAWQGRGIAKLLLAALMRTARDAGVRRFTGLVLAENEAALRLARELGATVEEAAPGLTRVELATELDSLPPTPAAAELRRYDRLLAG